MKRATKAFLLSALVFPGTGHLYLKKTRSGVALIVASCIAFYYLMVDLYRQAILLSEQIVSGAVPADIASVSALVTQHYSGSDGQLHIALLILLALWIIGMLDCYRLGRADASR